MPPVATYRGHWDGASGSSSVNTAPIPVAAGEYLVATVEADGSSTGATSATVTTASPSWGFTSRVDAFEFSGSEGAYVQICGLVAPASGNPVVQVTTTGPNSAKRRPSVDVWTVTGVDPSSPWVGYLATSGAGNNPDPIVRAFRSSAGLGDTLAIIAGADVMKLGAPYLPRIDGGIPGSGFDQPGSGTSGFSTAATWATPDVYYQVHIDPPGTAFSVYALAYLELRAIIAAPTVNAGADASWTYGTPAFTRTATESGGGGVTAREWKIVSGPTGAGTVLGTGATLSWSPTVPGAYVLRYSATNATGTGTDEMTLTVLGVVPTVDAGLDRTVDRTVGIIRTAGEGSTGASPIVTRQWRLMSGPGGSGAPVDLAAYEGDPKRCILPNTVTGAHVIRYTATNSTGPGYDEATITVLALRPTVNAGPDEARGAGLFTRTATEQAGDSPITAREWKIVEGPTSVGTVIGSAAALSWTPPSLGRWVLRYTATSAAGASVPDDCVITVGVTGVPLKLARTPAPRLAVAIAFGGNLADPDGSEWAFTEVTTDVRVAAGVHVKHGRSDEAGDSQPAQCRFTLDNRDGRYSLGGRSPYWPNVRQGTPIQVSCNLGSGFQTIFTGYADGFTPEWTGVPLAGTQRGDAVVRVSASGTLRRLAQGNPPQISPMRRALTTASGVVAYWPCEDEEGSRQIASAFPTHPAMDFSGRIHGGSNPGLPAATPRLGQSQVFDCSMPLPLISDSEWYGDVPDYTATNVILLRFLIDVPAAGSNDSAVLIGLITTGNPSFWELRYKSGGVINVRAWRHFSTLVLDQDVNFNLNGRRGQYGISLTQNGGAVDYQLDFLEVGASSAGIYNGSVSSSTLGKARRVQTATDGGHMDLTLGHIVVRNVARNAAENIRYLNAWRGENVGERLLRLVTENTLWYVQLDGPVLNVAITDYMGPQPSGTLLELLRTCEDCDQGILFDGMNPGCTYTTKRYRESRPPALILDATASEVGLPFRPVHDDAYRVNRAVASRRKGSNAVYTDVTGPLGSDIVGRYDDTLTTDVITDAALIQYAAWMVHQGTCEGYRYPQLSLNLTAAPYLLDEWLTVVPGDRVDVTNVRTVSGAAPGETVSLAVEGYEQTITPSTWHVIMNTSLYRRWSVAVVCDETGDTREFGARVDTNGSVIAVLTAAGQTALAVDVTAGPAWTTRADDYPLTLDVGAIPVRATACTAASGARQTFTIDPMPVTRPPGTRVQLWNPPVFAL